MQDIHIVERGNMDNPNKKQRGENDGLDIISNLPEEFKENILGRLPTDEAVRTILLSSQWRTTWMSVQELLFVCPITHSVENEIEILKINSRFNNLVDTALLMHNGAIRKVTLSISEGSYYCLDQWMQILANNGIQDLCIENQLMDYKYTLPPSFYACHSLRYVHLNMCIFLQLPPAFSEFNALHTLYLNEIHVSDDDFCGLIASCPSLENLHLKWLISVQTICVNAPRLRVLEIKNCYFRQINLDTPSLEYAWLSLNHITSMASQANAVSKTFGCLSRIKELHIHGRFFKFFGDKFTSTCNGLEILHLTMEIRDKEITAVLLILKSSPMLKELIIKIHQYDYYLRNNNTDVWNSQPKISLKHLEFAELWNYDESESTYAIVKLLMSSAPVLKNILY
ncbi:F-box/FBD/LRR protein [Rhynchospora pubera]|uniref:F-box/FBD/LRR protein n=1 Tax=Rhynchospora pubera TaxID=906938 RepID=A0AAV8EAS1_9POAL|nr:F-box/FBD/LRR protein [Rhynchospora pubera]